MNWNFTPISSYIKVLPGTETYCSGLEQRMILHVGERVFWGAPEVIYLEGNITKLEEATQSAMVHIDRATPNSSHLIGLDIPFFADGLTPLNGNSPGGVTDQRNTDLESHVKMSDDEKIRCAAVVAVRQKYGYTLSAEQEKVLIEQVTQALNTDQEMRARIITSMNEILLREQ